MRLELAEFAGLVGLLIVAALVGWAVSTGWAVAVVPGFLYVLASGTAYLVYRIHQIEQARASQLSQARPGHEGLPLQTSPLKGALAQERGLVAFQVVGVRGVCPLGRRQGELVSVDLQGTVTPSLCPHAEAALRLAAAGNGANEWCCPIYDHFLVFRRQLQAA